VRFSIPRARDWAALCVVALSATAYPERASRASASPAAPSNQAAPNPVAGPPALPVVILASSGPAPQQGQPVSEPDRVALDLRRTDRLIAVVRRKVSRSGNAEAQGEFAEAVKREAEARQAYEENLFARATRLTLEARSLARSAAVKVGPPEDDPYYVDRALDSAEEALDLAGKILDRDVDPRAWSRYEALRKECKAARRRYKDGQIRSAYEGALSVRDGVLQILRDSRPVPVSRSTAERAVERAQNVVAWAGKELGAGLNPAAKRWRQEAAALMGKARAAFARKEYRDTVIYSKLVERNLERAIAAQRSGVKTAA